VPLSTSITWERTPHPVRRPAFSLENTTQAVRGSSMTECPRLSRRFTSGGCGRSMGAFGEHSETKGIARGVVKFLTDMGLFIGQSQAFFEFLNDLAEDADEARRGR